LGENGVGSSFQKDEPTPFFPYDWGVTGVGLAPEKTSVWIV
jgi:hypothetical protein